ncbi:hypothetical protein D0869_07628 [Hortaea werneckii]|uniref:Zn(2)-C6 fungal-type domain-containing protein n=1 Tax=Hortaea werneckii TaxID=91943 RepID=A0A3M6WP53_HORWE|nr:hypothetical protein D0869_07628 [Hortaea werneckii]
MPYAQVRQACDHCRRNKVRCDERLPCLTCRTHDLLCQYREKPPKRTDENLAKLLQCIESHEKALASIANRIDGINGTRVTMYPSNKGQVSQRHEKVGLAGHLTTSNRPLLLCPSVKLMLKSVDVDLRDISVIGAEDQGFIRGESDVTQPGSPANHERSNDIGRGSEPHALTRVEGSWAAGFPMRPPGEMIADRTSMVYLRYRSGMKKPLRTLDGPDVPNANAMGTVRTQLPERWPSNTIGSMHSQEGLIAFPTLLQAVRPYAPVGTPLRWESTRATHPTPRMTIFTLTTFQDDVARQMPSSDRDVIPGLPYYAKACEVMGDQADGNDQIFLLAGLDSCNATAGRASLTFLDRYDLYNKEGGQGQGSLRGEPEMVKTKCQNLIVIATWTSLELERKIGLELRLPLSRIQKIEDRLPYPKQVPQDKNTTSGDTPETRLIGYVADPTKFVGKRTARLLWIFWRLDCVQIIETQEVNRSYLEYSLRIWRHVRKERSVREAAVDTHGRPRNEAELHLFEAIQGLGEAKVWELVRTCIEAAHTWKATYSSDLGNMVMLSAAFKSGVLKQKIDEERLKYLLERTISFLRRSTTCDIECGILDSSSGLFSEPRRTTEGFYRRRNHQGDVAGTHPFKEVFDGSEEIEDLVEMGSGDGSAAAMRCWGG